jgi:toxin ParE1/3/4
MNGRLVIKPLAEKDITESYTWYNQEQEGLGDTFLEELEKSFDLIEMNPDLYQIRYKEVRMAKINRFPICLHYTIEGNTVFIHAVLSTSRDPQIWKKRTL